MRTSLTLDEDVAVELKAEGRRSGRTLDEVGNQLLRLAIDRGRESEIPRERFVVKARSLGRLRPGLCLDKTGRLLAQIEGALHQH